MLTSNAAEQSHGGRIPSKAVEPRVRAALGDRDGHGDGLVELPPARLQGDDGAEGGLVPQGPSHHLQAHGLGLGGGHMFSSLPRVPTSCNAMCADTLCR